MTGQQQPEWHQPGMSEAEIAVYEAADRAAERGYQEAPVQPGDDIALKLQTLFAGFSSRLRAERAQDTKRPAA